ncbi:hypothetical protein [Microvirga yunnanensis]|nr:MULTISPECIES: hypothetical protein [unclassified Microvirga]
MSSALGTEVTFTRAEKLVLGPEAREQAMEAACRQISETIGEVRRMSA